MAVTIILLVTYFQYSYCKLDFSLYFEYHVSQLIISFTEIIFEFVFKDE